MNLVLKVRENAERQQQVGAQIATSSSPVLRSGQPTTPIYHQIITYNYPLPILVKYHGDVAGNWDFSTSSGAILR